MNKVVSVFPKLMGLCLPIAALATSIGAAPSLTRKADGSSYIGIFAETHSMRMAGVKTREMPKLPPGFKLPANVAAMLPGPPTRILTVRLWAPVIAPDAATASITPPAGLNAGEKLDLGLFRPTAPPTPGGGGSWGTGSSDSGRTSDLTIKIYWGSSATVQDGQPKVFKLSSLAPEQQMELGHRMSSMMPRSSAGQGGSYYYKDGWTTGYWPTSDQPGTVGENASLVGTYAISSSFAGNCSIEAPSNVDFLAPIEITSPDLGMKPALDKALALEWKPIPNATGLFASALGMEGKETLIIWTSSETYADQLMASMDFMQMSEVADAVSKHIFMPGSQSNVTIPAGIFQNASFAMMNMIGYGPGVAREDVKPVPRIQTKTTLMVMLKGGKGG